MEQHPTAPAKDLDIPLIVDWEQSDDELSKCFLAANPAHETIQPHHRLPTAAGSVRYQTAPGIGSGRQ